MTNLLWATDLAENMIIAYDPKQSMKMVRKIPAHYGRGHGLAKDKGFGDAGVDPAGNNTDSIFAGYVVRIDNTRATSSD